MDLPTGYYDAAQKLAEEAIRLWVISGEPLDDCPETLACWRFFCQLARVDPDELLAQVQDRLQSAPRLSCGHLEVDENTYIPNHASKPACRQCAREAGARRWER